MVELPTPKHLDLVSILTQDPAWRIAAKTTESDSDQIADVDDL